MSREFRFKVKCLKCRYARDFGYARITAEVNGAKHVRRFPHHEVELIAETVLHRFGGVHPEQKILKESSEIPF